MKNNLSILATRPKDDLTTNYLFYWAGKVLEEAKKKGCRIFDLKEKRANKKELCGVVNKTKPELLFLNGHGNPNIITGHHQEILIQSNVNEDITKDSVVYALSCKAAKILGVECVKKGARVFIGYKNDFIFLTEQASITHPLDDRTAALFLEPSNLIVTSLIKGHSAGDSHNRSQQAYKKGLRKLVTSESSQQDKSSLRFLIWDMENQVCLGNQSAKL